MPTTIDTTWTPSYWNDDTHGSSWERVKEALRRDWEQTKHDLRLGGKDLDQDVGNTVKQATGSEPIPPADQPTVERPEWNEIEPAVRYGHGARHQYGNQYEAWNDDLDQRLASDWDANRTGRSYEDVRRYVRQGWDAPR